MRSILIFIKEIAEILVIALCATLLIRHFLIQPFFVRGASMAPNFSNGDYLIIDELTYRFREPQRGEVIVFHFPLGKSNYYIKRIIGLPGETVEAKNGEIIIYNQSHPEGFVLDEDDYLTSGKFSGDIKKTILKENEYFVLGDNRNFSYDSRSWGPLKRENIVGRVLFRAWPITKAAVFDSAPIY